MIQVTSVSWSATYKDFFVATFGSFDFQKQTSGLVLGFSLKNPSYPECLFRTKSGTFTAQHHPHITSPKSSPHVSSADVYASHKQLHLLQFYTS